MTSRRRRSGTGSAAASGRKRRARRSSSRAAPVECGVQGAVEMADRAFESSELEALVGAAREALLDGARDRPVLRSTEVDEIRPAFQRRLGKDV